MRFDTGVFRNIKTPQDFAREEQEFMMRKRQQELKQQMQEQQLAMGPLQQQRAQLQNQQLQAQIDAGITPGGIADPASVREYQFFSQLSPEEQSKYLGMKRSQQTLNLGGTQAVLNPLGGIDQQYAVTPKASEMPEFRGQQAAAAEQAKLQQQLALQPQIKAATEGAKTRQEAVSELTELEATLPQLLDTVSKLSELGKVATYTIAGQGADIARRELGISPSQGAIARKEYESLVSNQVLPLLRQTFGAAFTEREGETLRKTLGDVNASPQEKDAVLRSFIDQKIAQIQTKQRQLGFEQTGAVQQAPLSGPQVEESVFNAKKAIKAGRDPQMVRQRLMEAGIDPVRAGL